MLTSLASTQASLYSPDYPNSTLPEGLNGQILPLKLENLLQRINTFNDALDTSKRDNKDRTTFVDLEAKGGAIKNPTSDDVAARAGYLLRLGEADTGIKILTPLTRRPSYFVFSTLSHLHAARGDWERAYQYLREGQLDTDLPQKVSGLSTVQRDWIKKMDEVYLPRFYQLRRQETEARKGLTQAALDRLNESEEILPLFPASGSVPSTNPVRFVNDSGVYQPGHLAETERAKLPPDAIAVVQQLLLWFPGETRLFWLLAELYAASKEFAPADTLFERCTWSLKSGSRLVKDHRTAVREALSHEVRPGETPLLSPETNPPVAPATPAAGAFFSMQAVFIYFGVIGLIALFALYRAIARKARRVRTPTSP
jgi:hypothetical protein